jgi:hypothetical protein
LTAELFVEHDATEVAVGEAEEPVKFPMTVLAATDAIPPTGSAVALVSVAAEGVPKLGVVKAGEVVPAGPPVPDDAPPRSVATPVPRPDTPLEIGRPVALVSVPALGVPRFGVVITQEVVRQKDPEPDVPVKE